MLFEVVCISTIVQAIAVRSKQAGPASDAVSHSLTD